MNSANYSGRTLDGKYRIERELGRGGMGTVYLATHAGTERHVAVKIIAPQFMERLEFIERFRREARAAGRLRHPNVVNVTDFGFAETDGGRVAYLVMEYLDGCTLGEILDEEHQLPLAWTLDILEQVSSAVHAAHEQGIIHRDLKPDNIWLEPNQRGGYTVKVLDFGIAKLEEPMSADGGDIHISFEPNAEKSRLTAANFADGATKANENAGTLISEKGTLIQSFGGESEKGTLIQPSAEISESETALFNDEKTLADEQSDIGTKLLSESFGNSNGGATTDKNISQPVTTKDLTRVGAVLGTPLFMSPEQCRGEKLAASSDIYSLGVIAYRMLSGKQPFEGDHNQVMQAHKDSPPPPFESKRVPRKVKQVLFAALAKNPVERPPTAEAFAAEMRAQSEGIGTLLRRSLTIYSEHLPKFLLLSGIFYLPLTVLTLAQVGASFLDFNSNWLAAIKSFIALATVIVSFTCGSLIVGTSTWLVAQILAFPLKPVRLRPALLAARRQWKKLIWTSLLQSILVSVGYAMCLVPGLIMTVIWGLASAVVMLESNKGFAALKRSKTLVRRSLRTTIATTLIMFFVPVLTSLTLAYFANLTVKDVTGKVETAAVIKRTVENKLNDEKADSEHPPDLQNAPADRPSIVIGPDKVVHITQPDNDSDKAEGKLRGAFSEALQTIIYLPISIVLISFFTIVSALLYFKSRQAGGESMQDLLAQFEEAEQPRTKWQEKVRSSSLT